MSKLHDKLGWISRQQSVCPQGTLVAIIVVFIPLSPTPLPLHAIFRQFSVPFLPEPSFIRDTKNISSQETKAEAMFPKLLAALKLKNTYMVQKISGTKEAKEAQQQDEEAGQSCSWGSCSRSCKEGATQRFVIERCQVAGKHTQTHTAGVLKKEMLHWQKIIEI